MFDVSRSEVEALKRDRGRAADIADSDYLEVVSGASVVRKPDAPTSKFFFDLGMIDDRF